MAIGAGASAEDVVATTAPVDPSLREAVLAAEARLDRAVGDFPAQILLHARREPLEDVADEQHHHQHRQKTAALGARTPFRDFRPIGSFAAGIRAGAGIQ